MCYCFGKLLLSKNKPGAIYGWVNSDIFELWLNIQSGPDSTSSQYRGDSTVTKSLGK